MDVAETNAAAATAKGKSDLGALPQSGLVHQGAGIEASEVEAVNSASGRSLYKKREPIYPKAVHGRFRELKWLVMIVTLGIYYGLPWIRWDRGPGAPDQAVLVDFGNSRFYFFFIEIWPQEVYYITGLLILAAVALFLVTALFGRVWCGYTCPQTVWTDLYLLVERWIEGDRNAQIKLARSPWTLEKLRKKAVKHAAWLLFAMATGGAWILYFHDAPTLMTNFWAGEAPGTAYMFFGLLTFTTYTLAGTMREQVCTYMCPWPRIQAAMIDENALNVTYRYDRGEPRGPHKKGESWDNRGDCIDCRQCVAACPMGIDIREGAQLECINCALCIDACDSIMERIGRPKGLIGYDTDDNVKRRQRGEQPHYKFIRTRTILYGSVLMAVALVMLFGLITRSDLDLNVLRDRNPTYVRLSDGSIRNGYTMRILNKSHKERTFAVDVEAKVKPDIEIIGVEETAEGWLVGVDPDRVRSLRILLTYGPEDVRATSMPVTFTVTDTATGNSQKNDSVFLSGER